MLALVLAETGRGSLRFSEPLSQSPQASLSLRAYASPSSRCDVVGHLRSPLSIIPAEISFRLFRNVHHHRF